MNLGVTTSRCRGWLVVGAIALSLAAAGATGPALAAPLLIGGVDPRSRGTATLVGWILGGAILGGAAGYGAASVFTIPLSTYGAAGLGIALGGGIGGISHLLSTDDPTPADDESVTVDMASESSMSPRPADLFDDHPDPVLYVTDSGGGPVVRAANAAYEQAFDLPAGALEDAPLGDVLVTSDDADELVDAVAAEAAVDAVYAFETPEGEARYRVRSVASTADGYLLFTPIDV